jgi:hypothetical protein
MSRRWARTKLGWALGVLVVVLMIALLIFNLLF